MGNQVKPVRFLLAGIGYGWLHCIGHVLFPVSCCPVILVGTLGESLRMGSCNYIKGCTLVREFGYTVPNMSNMVEQLEHSAELVECSILFLPLSVK